MPDGLRQRTDASDNLFFQAATCTGLGAAARGKRQRQDVKLFQALDRFTGIGRHQHDLVIQRLQHGNPAAGDRAASIGDQE